MLLAFEAFEKCPLLPNLCVRLKFLPAYGWRIPFTPELPVTGFVYFTMKAGMSRKYFSLLMQLFVLKD